jgi:stage III sporulation protein AF
MDFIKEWITNIILFVLLATVIDMLLPNSSMQKYTKMVTGLLLIAVILTPVLKLVSQDFEEAIASVPVFEASEEKNIENSIELKKKEIQALNHAYILEEMAVQVKKDVEEELMDKYQLEITKIEFVTDEYDQRAFPDNLDKVMVAVKQKEETQAADAVEVVKQVEINAQEALPSNSHSNEADKIAAILADRLEVNEKMIEVVVEGGT